MTSEPTAEVRIIGIAGLPEIRPGDDLGAIISKAIKRCSIEIKAPDILVVAQKIVSKAEGRMVKLDTVRPSKMAEAWAETYGKDPRVVEAALGESIRIVRMLIISDTFGRPWREGLVNVAVGAAGLEPLIDLRGKRDRNGQPLKVTVMAVADELASAAELVMGKAAGVPVALISGYRYERGDGSCRNLIRSRETDLFR